MTLQAKNFKELNEKLEKIAAHFFMARQMREAHLEERVPYELYLQKVEAAYLSLDEKERNLINNEFFYQNYHYWWIGLYSKTNFYRLKRRAMVKFLEAFYHA